MISLDDDEILGELFNTPEKKARWLIRIKLIYIFWIVFVILGILFLLLYHYLIN
jgi:predicted branched-subunit amino acid permease